MLNLNKREILFLKVLGGLILGLFVYNLIIEPLFRSDDNAQNTESPQALLKKLDDHYRKYKEMQAQNRLYETKLKNTKKSITTIVEEYTKRAGLESRRTRLKSRPGKVQGVYRRTITEVVFEKVSIQPIIKLIYDLENSNEALIKLGELDIRPISRGATTFDVKIKFESLKEQ